MKIETLLCICLCLILLTIIIVGIVQVSRRQTWSLCTDLNHCCYRLQNYKTHNFISDIEGVAPLTNDAVMNPWGLCHSQECNTSEVWVAQNAAGVLTLMTSHDGTIQKLVKVPSADPVGTETGSPSGVVCVLPNCCSSQNRIKFPMSAAPNTGMTGTTGGSNNNPALVVTVTEDGLICGYNPNVNADEAIVIKDNSLSLAVYKGCAITSSHFYACNFFEGTVEKYDSNWALQSSFSDPVMLAMGYAPFNVLFHERVLYVAFAQQNVDKTTDIVGDGNGFVLVFSLEGVLLKRLISRGVLNSPWGMQIYKQHIYIANFGDGLINVFDRCSGRLIGPLLTKCNVPLHTENIRGILFYNTSERAKHCASCQGMLFTAGIQTEMSGVVGEIKRKC